MNKNISITLTPTVRTPCHATFSSLAFCDTLLTLKVISAKMYKYAVRILYYDVTSLGKFFRRVSTYGEIFVIEVVKITP